MDAGRPALAEANFDRDGGPRAPAAGPSSDCGKGYQDASGSDREWTNYL